MSTVILTGLDSRTNSDIAENYCQKYGRILNCYLKSNQCTVTFADKHDAEEFIRSSPHRIDSSGYVDATWKKTLNRTSSSHQQQRSDNNNCRLTAHGTREQLEEKNLIEYFSRFGHIRMCLPNATQTAATITFDDRLGYERALKESRHFLNGRSLIVEPYKSTDEFESNKRMKLSDSNQSTSSNVISKLEYEKDQLINEQSRIENQYQERIKFYEYENFQLNEYLKKQQNDFTHQVVQYQYLLKQSLDEILSKDQQIEQLKKENKDIDDLLRQSVHDNEQQQIQLKKREDVHSQTKQKYEEVYKAYIKLKDNCGAQQIIDTPITSSTINVHRPKSSIDNVRKKL
ncbi:unnamed protein product [Rotaria socialis]|uniref:RRM domain-containing protein n=2 Tax=Rotaria socialis TaxID=392032 RepID=A0A818NBX6_9BILA|nr:unnamed protein product [Rotaria socialis]